MSNARNLANLLGTSTTIPSGKVVAGSLPAGSVLQVVETSMDSRLDLDNNDWIQVTGFEAAITPSSTSSKILVMCNINIAGDTGGFTIGARLYHKSGSGSYAHLADASSSDTTYADDQGCWFAAGAQGWSNYAREQASASYLHSPSSTAAQSYTLYVDDSRNNESVYVNRYHYQLNANYLYTTRSNFVLMEIAG